MTGLESRQLRGFTVGNLVSVVGSTVSIMATIMITYFNLKGDIWDGKVQQEEQQHLTELRMKVLEQRVGALELELNSLKVAVYHEPGAK